MVFILLSFFAILFVLLSKHLFQRWFNHLSIYVVIWFVMLTLYEMKLLYYYDLRFKTWFVIISSFLCFVLGIYTYFAAKGIGNENNSGSTEKFAFIQNNLFKNNAVVLKIAILITSLIGLAGAIQSWMVLFHQFKTLQNIILFANIIYQMRVQGSFEFVPYLSTFSYVSVFLGGLYTVKKGRLSFYLVLPFLGVILKDLAEVGRAGMFFALVEFISVLVLYRYGVNNEEDSRNKKGNKKLIFSTVFVFIFLIIAATVVKSARASVENYNSPSSTLNGLKGNLVITPSSYLYVSSDVGVLNKYLELDKESEMFGENTFMTIYRLLNKFKLVKKPQFYQVGYYIPMWTNTGTYLRELHADFGITGILLIPYCLGLFITFMWFRYFNTLKIHYLVILVYLYIIIFFSFLMFVPRLGNWVISFVLLLILIPTLEKISLFFIKRKQNNLKLEN